MSTPAITGARPPQRISATTSFLLVVIVALIVFSLFRSIFAHHDTKYETIASQMTVALQNNDLAGVEKFQNAETATLVTHAIVGRDADAFAPLGKLQRVRETTVPADESANRVHEFDATFDKGVVHETIRFDPDDKVVGFKYTLPTAQ
ncbi:MAG: hypothetical protein ABSH03_08265 [Candidatus Lustribacter sp.]